MNPKQNVQHSLAFSTKESSAKIVSDVSDGIYKMCCWRPPSLVGPSKHTLSYTALLMSAACFGTWQPVARLRLEVERLRVCEMSNSDCALKAYFQIVFAVKQTGIFPT